MLHLDTSYLVRLYTKDTGWEKVRTLCKTDHLSCCLFGQPPLPLIESLLLES